MLNFCDQNKGAISVFLTLILLPVLLLGGLTTDAARIYTSKVVISDAGEMAMNAGLAQYEETLHDEYGLLVMEKDPESISGELEKLFERSLNGSGLPSADEYHKILDLVTEQFEAINLVGSEIYRTEVEKQQIVEYMKYRAPVCLTELIIEKLSELKDTKKMAEAMNAQMEFSQKMEECQDCMEEAKVALDELNSLIQSYPSQNDIETELQYTEQDYTIHVSRCLLMIAAISHYTGADGRNDAEESAKSFIGAAGGVNMGDSAHSPESFNSYIECLYYQNGVNNASKSLDDLIDEHKANEPDEDDSDYDEWEERLDELEELEQDYNSAKSSVAGYSNQLRNIAYNGYIVPHTNTLSGYWEKSEKGRVLAEDAYEKLEEVQKKLKEAGEKWEVWSARTDELEAIQEGKSGGMKESVADYGKFFDTGDGSNDMNNLELLKEDVKTDKLYFNEMRDILTEEKFFGQSIARVDSNTQYRTYLNNANGMIDSATDQYDLIEDKRQTYKNNYVHTTISTAYVMERIHDDPFYKRLQEYCSNLDTPESEAEKQEANGKLDDSKEAGEEAKSEAGYPDYAWTMDEGMPSVLLGLVAADGANDKMATLDGNVNNKSGRKNALTKFKESINEATSFLDGLDRIISDNLENLYVAEYAMQMFSYYTVDKKDGETIPDEEVLSLSGYKLSEHKAYRAEVEYILWGNPSSKANVRNTVMTIFGIRMLFNSFFAFTNSRIISTSRNMATAIAGAAPYLIPVVQVLIELGYAGIETADDIAKIKDGYGVTIVKQQKYWRTGGFGGNNTEGITLNYAEYLRIFLNLNMMGEEKAMKKLARIADCIRVNTDYDMKNGYTMLAVEAKVKARTTFMKKISDMGDGGWTQPDNHYTIRYQSILGY
ncbi:MAG: hypothetical protein IKV59_00280 [Lachnospiraceae bacterium]|nr:hypothetical protein [Lachnospiraceae bacterium]